MSHKAQTPSMSSRHKISGPQLPPHLQRSNLLIEEEESGDDYGPMPLPDGCEPLQTEMEHTEKIIEIEQRLSKQSSIDTAPLARPQWMMEPPTIRQGATGPQMTSKSFSRKAHVSEVDSTSWTSTPSELKKHSGESVFLLKDSKKQKQSSKDAELLESVKKYNDATRGESLMKQHSTEKSTFLTEDVSLSKFDREKDMSTHRVDGKSRTKIIEQSKDLDNKFSHVKQLVLTGKSPLIVGLCGPQGSGKSTISSTLTEIRSDMRVITLSLDDFYLSHEDQQNLYTHTENPLLEFRGNCGTHDIHLLKSVLDDLIAKKVPIHLPKYDKSLHSGRGDRLESGDWTVIDYIPDIILIEGWCIGFKPLSNANLRSMYNNLNSLYTFSNVFQMNEALCRYQEAFYPLFDAFITLSVQDIKIVYKWRYEQEIHSNSGMLTYEQTTQFIDRFMPAYKLYYAALVKDGFFDDNRRSLTITLDENRIMMSAIEI